MPWASGLGRLWRSPPSGLQPRKLLGKVAGGGNCGLEDETVLFRTREAPNLFRISFPCGNSALNSRERQHACSRVPPCTRGASHTQNMNLHMCPVSRWRRQARARNKRALRSTHHPSLHRRATMFRLGYVVALLAPTAALSGETVVGLASTALRLSRRALQDLPSIPGMDMSGMPSIPGMDTGALLGLMDANTMLLMQQAMYCKNDHSKARPALRLSPLPLSHPRPRPTRPEPSPRVTSRRPPRASRSSSNSSTAR